MAICRSFDHRQATNRYNVLMSECAFWRNRYDACMERFIRTGDIEDVRAALIASEAVRGLDIASEAARQDWLRYEADHAAAQRAADASIFAVMYTGQ